MARTIEFEKTSNNQTRYKWSDKTTSVYRINAMNAKVEQEDFQRYSDSITIKFSTADRDYITFRKSEISTINGLPAPATVEETMSVLTDEVFAG